MNEALRTMCARIGYQFADESLVETAMRHRSYVAENEGVESNERLELDRKSTRLNSSHIPLSRMPSSA